MNQMVTETIFSYVLFLYLLLVSINLSNSLEVFMLLLFTLLLPCVSN